jgi:hypothetical protein
LLTLIGRRIIGWENVQRLVCGVLLNEGEKKKYIYQEFDGGSRFLSDFFGPSHDLHAIADHRADLFLEQLLYLRLAQFLVAALALFLHTHQYDVLIDGQLGEHAVIEQEGSFFPYYLKRSSG